MRATKAGKHSGQTPAFPFFLEEGLDGGRGWRLELPVLVFKWSRNLFIL